MPCTSLLCPLGRIRLSELVLTAVLIASFPARQAVVFAAHPQVRSSTASDFPTLSDRAAAARDAGRLGEAAALYRKALELRSDWKEGWWALGTILYDQEQHADAARAFERLVALDSKNGTAHLMLGLCQYQLDRDASAMEHIQAAKTLGVQTDGGLPDVLTYHEGMLFLRAGRYEHALETLRPLARAGVDDQNLDLAFGMGALLMRPKEASLEDAARRRIVLSAGRAERHYQAREFDQARAAYSDLAQQDPTFPNVRYAYGRFLLNTNDLENGVKELLGEVVNSPDHVRARMLIAAARYRVDSAAGIPFALDVVKLQPRYPFGHYLLGLLYFDTGDVAGAIRELEAAAQMVPQEAQFQFALGNAYARAGRKEDAARARAAFLELRKDDAQGAPGPGEKPRLDLDDAIGFVKADPKGRQRP
jgi:tetratricopeptide (TPR) repeat protein